MSSFHKQLTEADVHDRNLELFSGRVAERKETGTLRVFDHKAIRYGDYAINKIM